VKSFETAADILRRKIRMLIAIFMLGLIISGLTAFPLLHELNILASLVPARTALNPPAHGGLTWWILHVREGLKVTYANYPFMAYGTDWLAFAHLVIAIHFIGPWRDPVRNVWVMQAGLIACIAVIPLALICGPLRGIPFYWRLIDCSFGIFGCIPLWFALRLTRKLEQIA
jgi:hypothetical protein